MGFSVEPSPPPPPHHSLSNGLYHQIRPPCAIRIMSQHTIYKCYRKPKVLHDLVLACSAASLITLFSSTPSFHLPDTEDHPLYCPLWTLLSGAPSLSLSTTCAVRPCLTIREPWRVLSSYLLTSPRDSPIHTASGLSLAKDHNLWAAWVVRSLGSSPQLRKDGRW